ALARLTRADHAPANPIRTSPTGAQHAGANPPGPNLTGANLSEADLIRADLIRANLTGANLSRMGLFETIFGDTDLLAVQGLETCHHHGPSILDYRTLVRSGLLPLAFLRRCGLPVALI